MGDRETIVAFEQAGRVLARSDRRIGSLLAEDGKLGAKDIERIMDLQHNHGYRFGDAAMRLGLVTGEDVERAVARQYDLPHLAPGKIVNSELVVAYEPFHRRAEELRGLRTQLLIRWTNGAAKQRVLTVVSPGAGEGRSYITANLAAAFAQLGERTLLIDADLRSPRQHQIFGIANRVGLSAVLSGRADGTAVVPLPELGRLSVLPSGAIPPNPQELLSRRVLGILLHELRANYDVIFIDTPPALACADAQCVAFRAGSAIVINRKDHTRLSDSNTVVKEMSEAGTQVIGAVLNSF
jgi:chain length determinant protein tyrosine kinase EpsG